MHRWNRIPKDLSAYKPKYATFWVIAQIPKQHVILSSNNRKTSVFPESPPTLFWYSEKPKNVYSKSMQVFESQINMFFHIGLKSEKDGKILDT